MFIKGEIGKFKGKNHSLKSRRQISLGKSKYDMTFEKADMIRRDSKNMSRKDLIKKYSVTYCVIRDILLNVSWIRAKPIARASKPAIDF